jgi:hypothetical protein
MQFATLLFYAATSFFLGLVALATGGALVLDSMFNPSGFAAGGSHEPWQSILEALTIAVPLVFVVLAAISIVRPAGDAPASAAQIRDLILARERAGTTDRALGGRSDTYHP